MINELIVWIGFAAFVLFLFVILVFRQRKLVGRLNDLEKRLANVLSRQESTRKQLAELHSGAIGLGNKFVSLESKIENLQSQQQIMSDFDPDSKLYSRAVKMVELGADLEEVMAECELPKAEAELLLSLHRQ